MKPLRRIWRSYVSDLRDAIDAESAEHRKSTAPALTTRHIAVIVFTGAFAMMLVRFGGNEESMDWLGKLLHDLGFERASRSFFRAITKSPDRRINTRICWAVVRIVAYAVLPILALKLILRDRIADYGVVGRGRSQAPLYLLFFLLVIPFVIAASYGPAFQAKYPYYKLGKAEALWPNFVLWEALYAAQFVALEFFFRGFLVQGLRKQLGYAAVFMPIIPYATIHFNKPLPEAIGSVITGFVLGTMVLKTRSIWGGAAIHVSVACSMDLLSLWHQKRL